MIWRDIVEYLTKEKCIELGIDDYNCYIDRWEYWRVVVNCLKVINPESCLELGAREKSIVLDGDTMNKCSYEDLTYMWNAFKQPWPIKNKQYDVFVALQVWEHLKGNQNKVFKEVVRISNWAILSFPFKWRGNSSHSKINKSKISRWNYPYVPFAKPIIAMKKRIIYIYKFSKEEKKDKKIKKQIELIREKNKIEEKEIYRKREIYRLKRKKKKILRIKMAKLREKNDFK
jgi:hypothetical protein